MDDYRRLYRELRNYLAGQHLGSTRDEVLLQEVVKALLCKGELDASGGPDRIRAGAVEYRRAWGASAVHILRLLHDTEPLAFEDETLLHRHDLLGPVDLRSQENDALGDLYEIFMGSVARGQQGQFFTPSNAVQLLVELVQPQPGEVILDPACGAGGFLAASARYQMRSGEISAHSVGNLWGIDKDSFLSRLAALRLALLTGSEANVWCADSLAWRAVNDDAQGIKGFTRRRDPYEPSFRVENSCGRGGRSAHILAGP